MLDKNRKDAIIKKYKTHTNDTGSSQVQIAILSEEIKELTEHLKIHKKDHSSRRGLLRKVSLRRSLLKYLAKEDLAAYEDLIKKLKIKKRFGQEVKLLDEDELIAADVEEEVEEVKPAGDEIE
jgi:small subunit ribosomal protein S15